MSYSQFEELPVSQTATEFAWKKIHHDRRFEEFDDAIAEFRRRHFEMPKKRQQDTAVLGPAIVAD